MLPHSMQATRTAFVARTEMPQQAFYNTPVQLKNKSKSFSVPGMIFLVISLVASIIISIGQFMDNETGMGIVNIAYFVATIVTGTL